MRILVVTNMYPTTASPARGTYVQQQVESLRELGLLVDVWFLDRLLRGRGVYLRMSAPLQEKVKMGNHDLVHIMYGGMMADLATRAIPNVPKVVTLQGSDLLRNKLFPTVGRLSAYFGVLASGRAARRADGIITVSPGLKEALPSNIDRSKVRVIPCGIDLDRFKPQDARTCRQKLGWDNNAVHILFATAGGDPVKRPELASRAVDALGMMGVRAELHILQGTPYECVPTWINACDALILTSKREGSPTIVKECLACQVPVVSVDVGDVRDQIAGIDGCVIAPGNPRALAAGLRYACSTQRHIHRRRRVEQYSLRRIAERLHEFYSEIVISTRSGDPLHGEEWLNGRPPSQSGDTSAEEDSHVTISEADES